MIGTAVAVPVAGASSSVSREIADCPAGITWLRTNRIQRPSREKRGASSLRSRVGGLVSCRTTVPSGRSSQIERCSTPNSAFSVFGPAAAVSMVPDGAHAGETQLSFDADSIVRWRQDGGHVATSVLSSCVSRLGPVAAISRFPHQVRKSGKSSMCATALTDLPPAAAGTASSGHPSAASDAEHCDAAQYSSQRPSGDQPANVASSPARLSTTTRAPLARLIVSSSVCGGSQRERSLASSRPSGDSATPPTRPATIRLRPRGAAATSCPRPFTP